MQKNIIYFTKDKKNKIRVYQEIIDFKSEKELKGVLSQRDFDNKDEKFYVIFDIN